MAKVLIADDDLEILELLKFTFENENYEVLTACDGEEAVNLININKPDIILLDVNMPKLTGYEVLEKVRQNSATSLTPVIMLTSLTKTKDKITGIKLGADEYVGKPFEPFEIVARVEGLLKRIKVSLSANPLTGIPGNISIENEIKKRLENNEVFSVAYVDADNFKSFNDKYGFERGDSVIRLIGVILRSAIAELGNKEDYIGHLGGEDFILISSKDKIRQIVEKSIEVFDSLIPCQYDAEERTKGYMIALNRHGNTEKYLLMSISIGIISVDPASYKNYSQVVEKVNEVLKSAKAIPGSVYKME
ncbi:MAG: response regulator [Elusimicrobia bacterium]|nr:response regulator [Candidatus Liberimonas magnetica]